MGQIDCIGLEIEDVLAKDVMVKPDEKSVFYYSYNRLVHP
jgi:hypothetical protein